MSDEQVLAPLQDARIDWTTIERFARDFLGFAPSEMRRALALVIGGAATEALAIFLVAPLLSIAEHSFVQGGATVLLPRWWPAWAASGHSALSALLMLIAAALLVRLLLVSHRQEALSRLEMGYFMTRQTSAIAALASAPWPTLVRLKHARITHLLTNDMNRMGLAATGLLQSLTAVVTLIIQAGVAMLLSPSLTILSLLLALVTLGFTRSLFRTAQTTGEEVTGANLAALTGTDQFLSSMKSAIAENMQSQFAAEFGANRRQVVAAELAFVRRQGRSRMVIGMAGLIIAVSVAVTGFMWLALSPATIIALLALLSRMAGPAAQLQSQLLELVRAMPAYRHVVALEQELAQSDPPVATRPEGRPSFGKIELERVSYHHASPIDSHMAAGLTDVSMTIRAGEFLGIAGPSGAGKTTLADLLVGLVDPDAGTIRIDGEPTLLRSARWWRDQLAYVPQDPFLRHASVRDNLLATASGASEEDLAATLAVAGAAPLVQRLPQGLDTVVGDRGTLLSGGERQRIALARALLRKPKLLVLDEATNALDQSSEHDVLSRLSATRMGRTIILITHRTSSLEQCDRIAIIEAGRLRLVSGPSRAARAIEASRTIEASVRGVPS